MRHFNGLTSYCWWKNSRSYSFLLYRREMEQRDIVRGMGRADEERWNTAYGDESISTSIHLHGRIVVVKMYVEKLCTLYCLCYWGLVLTKWYTLLHAHKRTNCLTLGLSKPRKTRIVTHISQRFALIQRISILDCHFPWMTTIHLVTGRLWL